MYIVRAHTVRLYAVQNKQKWKKNVSDNECRVGEGRGEKSFCVHVNSILQCNLLEAWKTYVTRVNGYSLSVETIRPLSVIDFQFAMKWQTTKNHPPIVMTKENNKSPKIIWMEIINLGNDCADTFCVCFTYISKALVKTIDGNVGYDG